MTGAPSSRKRSDPLARLAHFISRMPAHDPMQPNYGGDEEPRGSWEPFLGATDACLKGGHEEAAIAQLIEAAARLPHSLQHALFKQWGERREFAPLWAAILAARQPNTHAASRVLETVAVPLGVKCRPRESLVAAIAALTRGERRPILDVLDGTATPVPPLEHQLAAIAAVFRWLADDAKLEERYLPSVLASVRRSCRHMRFLCQLAESGAIFLTQPGLISLMAGVPDHRRASLAKVLLPPEELWAIYSSIELEDSDARARFALFRRLLTVCPAVSRRFRRRVRMHGHRLRFALSARDLVLLS